MLRSLSVENYALIDRLELDLSESLNTITGETGAGKSIILGALGLLLGNRADAAVIMDGGRNCIVEGVFNLAGYALEGFFAENDLDYEPLTTIRRIVSPAGKSRSYINDLPVQQATVKELSSRLIDIHSQHQGLMLAQDGFRTGIVDSAAGNGSLFRGYVAAFEKLRAAKVQLAGIQADALQNRRDQEWLEFQVGQFRDADLHADEQVELEMRQAELSHAEEIKSVLLENVSRLDGDENGIVAELKLARQSLSGIVGQYPPAAEYVRRIDSVLIELRDMGREFASEAERAESDPARLEEINDRLATIYSLQQKHRVSTVAELLDIQCDYESKLAVITGSDEAIEALEKEVAELRSAAGELAGKLTQSRRKAAAEVSAYVEKTAAALGMPAAKFAVEIAPAPMNASGADEIRFMFSANKNVAPAPVEKVASGGEMSRIMLALKALVAKSRSLPTIIFDEIDTGVSGSVADAMGRIIEELGDTMQVVNITHLPQVASKGDAHFVVYKDAASRTRIRRLTLGERVVEIAKMLSGQAVTDAALTQARLLLE